MGDLQWALLIFCIVLVAVFFFLSRRASSRRDQEDNSDQMFSNRGQGDQMDLLNPGGDNGQFDELGVGKARKAGQSPSRKAQDAVTPREPPAPSMATLLDPLPGQAAGQVNPRSQRSAVATSESAPAAAPAGDQKTVALIIAPTEEKDIRGPQIHAALSEQGLSFGEGEVYHRRIGGKSIYSVSSLLKPGKLVPSEADAFSTKGLTVVLDLPGPVNSAIAFDDFIDTAKALATGMELDIFDAAGNRVDEAVADKLKQEVEDWSQANNAA